MAAVFPEKHTSLSFKVKVGEVKHQADGWNLSEVFLAWGVTSYSNLTSVFGCCTSNSLGVSVQIFQHELTIVKTIVWLKYTDPTIYSGDIVDKSLKYK